MTRKDAIKQIKKDICCERPIQHICKDSCLYGGEQCAYSLAIEALEKQIPKKVVYHDDSGNKTVSERCPSCFEIAHSDYCEYCGQAIDWSEEND